MGFWGVPLVLGAVWLVWRGGFRGRVFVAVAVLAFGITDGVVGRSVKHSVSRLRPHQSEPGVRQLDLQRPAWKGLFLPVKTKVSLGNSTEQELCLMLIHGVLHIVGYDHEADGGEMEKMQGRLFEEMCHH